MNWCRFWLHTYGKWEYSYKTWSETIPGCYGTKISKYKETNRKRTCDICGHIQTQRVECELLERNFR